MSKGVKVNKHPGRLDFNHRIMRWAGTEWGGNDHPPGDHMSLKIPFENSEEYRVYHIGEDGHTLWIGFRDDWHWHMDRPDAHKVAKFIIWDWWIKAEWFGLRRWAYYKALHRAVNKYKDVKPIE